MESKIACKDLEKIISLSEEKIKSLSEYDKTVHKTRNILLSISGVLRRGRR